MASGWLVVFLGCLGLSSATNASTLAQDLELQDTLLRVIARLRFAEDFNTLLVYGEECVFHSLLRHLDTPTVVVTSGSTDFDWNFSSSTLILTCGLDADREENSGTTLKLQGTRRLIFLENDTQPESICYKYSLKEQHNIAIVKSTFGQSDIIYTCRFFQTPNHKEVPFFADEPIYIENFLDMRGAEIRTVLDQMIPRTMVYLDKKTAQTRMMGYLANLVNNYAQRVSAKVSFLNITTTAVVTYALRWVQEELLDIGTILVDSDWAKNMDIITYPYLLSDYCLMIPVPAKLPYNQVYIMIMDYQELSIIFVLFCVFSILIIYTQNLSWRNVTLANVLLNDKSLRGLLGQSFPFPPNPSKKFKLIIFVLCFTSVMFTSLYLSYLQAFFTHPPFGPHIRSFRDIANFPFKMAVSRLEATRIASLNDSDFLEISEDHLLICEDVAEYLALRDSFNSSLIFPVSADRWEGFEGQQKNFGRPVFYFSDLCFRKTMFYSLPVRKYLPYRHLFEDHILRQHEFGLVLFWKSRSFFDMAKLGLAPFKDHSQKIEAEKSLVLDDISWILKLYLVAMALSTCCFLLEVSGCMERWGRFWRCRRLGRS